MRRARGHGLRVLRIRSRLAPRRSRRSINMAGWQIRGEYMETCNCTLLCPCIWSNMAAQPTEGDCKAAVTLRIDKGAKDGVTLDGLSFIVMLHAPGPMGN